MALVAKTPPGAKPEAKPPHGPEASATTAEEIARLSAALNARADEVKKMFAAVTKAFRKSGLGVRGQVELRKDGVDEDTHLQASLVLSYGKGSSGWGFYVERQAPGPEETQVLDSYSIENANREIRMLAAKALPRLHAELSRELRSQLQEADEAVNTGKSVIGNLAEVPESASDDNDDDAPSFRRDRPSFGGGGFRQAAPPTEDFPAAPADGDDDIPF